MNPLWVLKGSWDAPGWKNLEKDSKEDNVDLVVFDKDRWALIRAEEPPKQYEGLDPQEPVDGMYVSESGYPIYVVNKLEVANANAVIEALGQDAKDMLETVKDPDTVLQRLGRAY